MSEELQDEVSSINAIYGDRTLELSEDSNTYILISPAKPNVSVRIEFPPDYPSAPPSILGTHSVGEDVPKGEGTTIVDLLRSTLSTTYQPNLPCIFDLLEEFAQRLPTLTTPPASPPLASSPSRPLPQPRHDLSITSPWVLSDPITEKKSIFIARAARVSTLEQAQSYINHLLSTDKRVARATHNITAWRIQHPRNDVGGGDGGMVRYQDCDDDGETAAGGRVLKLLELMDVWGVMVVVTRWYGGVLLGGDRFRIIGQCAREAVVRLLEGEGEEGGGGGKSGKGRKKGG